MLVSTGENVYFAECAFVSLYSRAFDGFNSISHIFSTKNLKIKKTQLSLIELIKRGVVYSTRTVT